MRFGTIGAGAIGQALARHVIKAGYPVTLSNSRGPETLADVVADIGPLASAGTVAQAAEADIVFLATYYTVAPGVLDALPNWNGRILIDTTNLLDIVDGTVVPVDIGDQSSSEIIAAHAPGARVVKAFNTLYAKYIEPDPATKPAAKSSSTPVTTSTPRPPSAQSSTNSALPQSISGHCAKAADLCRSTGGHSPACTCSNRTDSPRANQQSANPK
jgi:predicted dinucleotide-binding enzyme